MEAAHTIGNNQEWTAFKKEIEALRGQIKRATTEKSRLRMLVKTRTETIRQLKYKLKAVNHVN